jgi:hypothetical protein
MDGRPAAQPSFIEPNNFPRASLRPSLATPPLPPPSSAGVQAPPVPTAGKMLDSNPGTPTPTPDTDSNDGSNLCAAAFDEPYNYPLHVAVVFIILGLSMAGTLLPVS